jgi:hypothetical protein
MSRVPAHLSAVNVKVADYHWHRLEPLPATPTIAPATEPELPTVQPETEPKAAAWKPGQVWNLPLMNSDHKEWSRQFHDICQASPEWHDAQAKMAAENAARREAREAERRERKLNRKKAA